LSRVNLRKATSYSIIHKDTIRSNSTASILLWSNPGKSHLSFCNGA
jgi:hypothetical protein